MRSASYKYVQDSCVLVSIRLIIKQAVEVGRPNATYELIVKTAMPRGSAIPKGRVSLPREPKPKAKDKVLVFADGKAAEEAKKAGADIVGGAELVEGVESVR
jgi:large subunit ribosomal protein L1